LFPLILLAFSFVLIVTGVALASIPAAIVVAGVLLGIAALVVDFDQFGKRGDRGAAS
jgi:hypothetical protein